jgi:general nucleoside transport system permease protein
MTATLSHEEVTTSEVVEVPQPTRSRVATGVAMIVAALAALMFGLNPGDSSDARFRLASGDAAIGIPVVAVPVTAFCLVMAVVAAVLGLYQLARGFGERARPWVYAAAVFCFVAAFLGWATTGGANVVLDVPALLRATIFLAVPLMLGAMAGVIGERSGVINVAIEGQMLAGAFLAAVVGTVAHNLGAGVIGAIIAGGLVGALLAVFAIRYLVNQVVLGVVINLLILGLTNYLFSSLLQRNQDGLNNPGFFGRVKIPVLSEIPIIGPALFDTTWLTYIAYLVVIAVQFGLYRTRWGLRTRAIGEHPKAADTAGIDVNRLRFWNVVLGGAVAGLAGAVISIGSIGGFQSNMTDGKGFIALAAVIFGRWTPLGATGAALFFGFTNAVADILGIIDPPVDVPGQFLSMLPYLATIVVVAGVVGRVRAPAADGIPYVKS